MTDKSTSQALTDGETILAAVEIAASPERIFRALTTDEVEKWWIAPGVYRIVNWKADLRVGGRWSLGVQLPDGTVLPARGTFLEIDAPHRLVQTRTYDFDHPTLGRRDTTVTCRLQPGASGTRVSVRHDGFAGTLAAEEHAVGWERFLSLLAAYLKSA
jgi:uncharacterized protein YndB with AHSA1/START domain